MLSKLKWGLFSGLISGCWMYVQLITGIYKTPIGRFTGFLPIIIMFVAIYLAIYQTRENENNGYIDFKKATKTGISVTILSALIMTGFTYLYYKFISPDFLNYIVTSSREYFFKLGKKEEEILQEIDNLKKALTPRKQCTSTMFTMMLFGSFFSIISGMLMRKEKKFND